MARVTEFFVAAGDAKPHRTQTRCSYRAVLNADGQRLLQLTTYGSPNRQRPEKGSQHLEVDEDRARELLRILGEVFPGLRSDGG